MISVTEMIQLFYKVIIKQPLACMIHTSNQKRLSCCVAKKYELIKKLMKFQVDLSLCKLL